MLTKGLTKRLFVSVALTASTLLAVSGIAVTPAANAATVENTPFPGGPMVRAASGGSSIPTISENWSGYAATSAKAFTYVHSTFVEPAITCPGVADQWTSNWVGLDGFNDSTVEQDGTFAHCGGSGNTTPKYQAWYEMYPAGSVTVFNVKPGDIIDASVTYASGEFSLKISDLTSGKSATDVAALHAGLGRVDHRAPGAVQQRRNQVLPHRTGRLRHFHHGWRRGSGHRGQNQGRGRFRQQLPNRHGRPAVQRRIRFPRYRGRAERPDVHRDLGPVR